MKSIVCIISILALLNTKSFGQSKIEISTIDISNFWEAYDSLAYSNDSIRTFQRLYIDRASAGLKGFIKVRDLKATDYVRLIKRYPKFWQSLRPKTMNVISRQVEMEKTFEKFNTTFSHFKPPKVCFAIGKLNTGGTISKGYVLIGTEIVCANATTDESELEPWLQNVVGDTRDIISIIAHEVVHTQQPNSLPYIFQYVLRRHMFAECIREGAADYISEKITGISIRPVVFTYGEEHLHELKKEFLAQLKSKDISPWLYNGATSKNRPADLGYYIGYKICEAYYQNATNKEKAMHEIIKTKNPKKFLKKSGFMN